MKNSTVDIVVVALIAIIAIGGAAYFLSQSNNGYTTTQSTTTATTQSTTVATTTISKVSTIQNFTISESEYNITPSKITVSAGSTVVLNIKNVGTIKHDLVVIGSNFSSSIATNFIVPGSNLTVSFPAPVPGNYFYYSNIANDRELGILGVLTVT